MRRTIEYNKTIYDKKIIENAIADFYGVVSIRLKDSKDVYTCIFSSFKSEQERTIREFENYIIALMNQHGE